jgi:hypothetical protein
VWIACAGILVVASSLLCSLRDTPLNLVTTAWPCLPHLDRPKSVEITWLTGGTISHILAVGAVRAQGYVVSLLSTCAGTWLTGNESEIAVWRRLERRG